MAIITYHGERQVEVDDLPRSLLDISLAHRIPHMHECGGNGRCTTCRVRVLEGREHLTPPGPKEQAVAGERGWDAYTRLACQARTTGPITVERLVRTTVDLHRLWAEAFPRGGTERRVAVLFADIRGFTEFASAHLPHDVMHWLNGYFARACEPILNNNGYIDKYIGDGVLALFGMKDPDGRRACRDAVRAALGMLQAADAFARGMQRDIGCAFRIGVGLHFGDAITGVVGHPSRPQFTAIGDTVNAACRIEPQNKRLGTRFLASPAVVGLLEDEIEARPHPAPGGRLFEVVGFTRPDPLLVVQTTAAQALSDPERFAAAFYARLFEIAPAARALFTKDMTAQGKMFTSMIQSAVAGLSRFEDLKPGILELGRRHAKYGVEDAHYPVVKQAFLDALAGVLGDAFTPDARSAWAGVFDTLGAVMKTGSASVTE